MSDSAPESRPAAVAGEPFDPGSALDRLDHLGEELLWLRPGGGPVETSRAAWGWAPSAIGGDPRLGCQEEVQDPTGHGMPVVEADAFGPEMLPRHLLDAARRMVCAHARDVHDARELLLVLGLMDGPGAGRVCLTGALPAPAEPYDPPLPRTA